MKNNEYHSDRDNAPKKDPVSSPQELRITKIGHCCMVIETSGVRILTDPGRFTTDQNGVTDIDIILITHEHADHLHIPSLKEVLKGNPDADVVTNQDVGDILEEEDIDYRLVEHGQHMSLHDVSIEGFGDEHAEIFQSYNAVKNTGYLIDGKFFYPGDAFYNPGKPVDVLALPITGPWMRIKDAITYAREVHPRVCFPVHDALLSKEGMEVYTKVAGTLVSEGGVEMKVPDLGTPTTFS